jgi:hypothetical protein
MAVLTRGVCYVAIGPKAERACARAIEHLHKHADLDVSTMDLWRAQDLQNNPPGMDSVQMSRWAKVNLDLWSPYDETLYLDADTQVLGGDIDVGWDILADGWDIVIVPSEKQGPQWLRHCGEKDRAVTLSEVGASVQLQAGVFWFRKSEAVARLFAAWREEWLRFKNQDQGALLRALYRVPVRIWLIGHPFNGGSVVAHLYGTAREN